MQVLYKKSEPVDPNHQTLMDLKDKIPATVFEFMK
jgi:hypothetical protein